MGQKDTDIKIGGRLWSTTVEGKIIDASQIEGLEDVVVKTDLNIKNGEAIADIEGIGKVSGGSIKSASLYDDDAQYKEEELPVASGHESIAWGKKCKAIGKRSVAIGNNNKSGGNCSFAVGQSNTIAPAANSTASGTVVMGFSNTATRNYSFTGGYKNTNEGEASVVIGAGNTAGTNTTRAVVIGDTNTANANSQVIIGKNNTGRQANQVLVGKYLSPDYAGVFLGNYAAEKPSVLNRNVSVVIAAGRLNEGKNIIECYSRSAEGPAECLVLAEPISENGVVRLKELNNMNIEMVGF